LKNAAFFVFVLAFSSVSFADRLDDFEVDAKTKKSSSKAPKSEQNNSKLSNFIFAGFSYVFYDVGVSFVQAISDAGAASFKRASSYSDQHKVEQESSDSPIFATAIGKRYVPFVRLDLQHGSAGDDVSFNDMSIETGYGAVALLYRNSLYKERDPADELSMDQLFLLYRMLVSERVKTDLGIGRYRVMGNDSTSDIALKFALGFNFTKKLGIEISSVSVHGANLDIADREFGILYDFDALSLKLGYRSVDADSHQLRGILAGLSFQY
jgi:hypothetical protein